MEINNEYNLGEIVYIKTDEKQLPRIVVSILVMFGGIKYLLGCGTDTDYSYAQEISKEKSFLTNSKKIGF